MSDVEMVLQKRACRIAATSPLFFFVIHRRWSRCCSVGSSIPRAAETAWFHRVGNAPRVDGKTAFHSARRAGRRPRGETRAIALFNIGCRRVFETHQNKAGTVRLEDSTAPYNRPSFKKAMALR